jgi:hypothetical protein
VAVLFGNGSNSPKLPLATPLARLPGVDLTRDPRFVERLRALHHDSTLIPAEREDCALTVAADPWFAPS